MKHLFSLLSGVLVLAASSAHAVVLEQKFRVGETLFYQTNLNGTLNFQLPSNVPFPLAGIPLNAEIMSQSKSTFQTLGVDAVGTGTLLFDVPQADMNALVLGQKAKWNLRNGQATLQINAPVGAPIVFAGPQSAKAVFRISRTGQFAGFEKITDKTAVSPAKTSKEPTASAEALDQTTALGTLLVKSLPQLWPGRDVKIGEKWARTVNFPMTNALTGDFVLSGQFEMTLKGQENGLWRVGVDGGITTEDTPIEVAPLKNGETQQLRVQGATYKLKGDLWFDAERGQIARAEFMPKVSVQAAMSPRDGKSLNKAWFNFAGTMQIDRVTS